MQYLQALLYLLTYRTACVRGRGLLLGLQEITRSDTRPFTAV